jgi:hypothetical protein
MLPFLPNSRPINTAQPNPFYILISARWNKTHQVVIIISTWSESRCSCTCRVESRTILIFIAETLQTFPYLQGGGQILYRYICIWFAYCMGWMIHDCGAPASPCPKFQFVADPARIFYILALLRKKIHVWTLKNFNDIFGPFARRHSQWRRGNTARRHRLWRRGACYAGPTWTTWRQRGTKLGAKIYGAELGYVTVKYV